MADWDIYIDERKDGSRLLALGALILHAGVAERVRLQLRRVISKREGSGCKIGEIHWSGLSEIEAAVAREWIEIFLSVPMTFFVHMRVREHETKASASLRLVEYLESETQVPGSLSRTRTTVHLDIDESDSAADLERLRSASGVLRVFRWESKGSLLLQLSDLLLGLAKLDRDSSHELPNGGQSKASLRKWNILDHARAEANRKADRQKRNAVVDLDENNRARFCLFGP